MYQRRPNRYQKQIQEESVEEWQADRIYMMLKGKLMPTKEFIISTLNAKRRKEGIYVGPKRHEMHGR